MAEEEKRDLDEDLIRIAELLEDGIHASCEYNKDSNLMYKEIIETMQHHMGTALNLLNCHLPPYERYRS